MLNAVVQNPSFEGLENYILGGRKRSAPNSAVPSQRVSNPRFNAVPGSEIPSGKKPIPSSSQKPMQQTNAKIPYARFMFVPGSLTVLDDVQHDIGQGDIVFVHKQGMTAGNATNQITRVVSLAMLNNMLSKGGAEATLSMEHAAKMLDVNLQEANSAVEAALADLHRTLYMQNNLQIKRSLTDEEVLAVEALRAVVLAAEANQIRVKDEWSAYHAPKNGASAVFPMDLTPEPFPHYKAVPLLASFSVDGVVINVDDTAMDIDSFRTIGSDGCIINVAVQGPVSTRNTRSNRSVNVDKHSRAPQIIDDGALVMDKWFVGLFHKGPGRDENGAVTYAFEYKCFSGRQAYAKTMTGGDLSESGPSYTEFTRLCAAWRIGSVMDNAKVKDFHERQVTLNVIVEEWSFEKLGSFYSSSKGQFPPFTFAPQPPLPLPPPPPPPLPPPVLLPPKAPEAPKAPKAPESAEQKDARLAEEEAARLAAEEEAFLDKYRKKEVEFSEEIAACGKSLQDFRDIEGLDIFDDKYTRMTESFDYFSQAIGPVLSADEINASLKEFADRRKDAEENNTDKPKVPGDLQMAYTFFFNLTKGKTYPKFKDDQSLPVLKLRSKEGESPALAPDFERLKQGVDDWRELMDTDSYPPLGKLGKSKLVRDRLKKVIDCDEDWMRYYNLIRDAGGDTDAAIKYAKKMDAFVKTYSYWLTFYNKVKSYPAAQQKVFYDAKRLTPKRA